MRVWFIGLLVLLSCAGSPCALAIAEDNAPFTRDPAGYSQSDKALAIDRASEHLRYGYALSQRRAYYSARQEFIQALRVIAKALDAESGGACDHERSLEGGLRALHDVERVARSSQGSKAALQQHLHWMQERLTFGGGTEPAASHALYALARVEVVLAGEAGGRESLAGPTAIALHQAAMAVDRSNYLAANELGALFARYGQLEDARRVLLEGLSVSATPQMWHNLAEVYERTGRTEQAEEARRQRETLAASWRNRAPTSEAAPPGSMASLIHWAEPAEFIRCSSSQADDGPSPGAGEPAATKQAVGPKPAEKKPSLTLLPAWIANGLKNLEPRRSTSQVK